MFKIETIVWFLKIQQWQMTFSFVLFHYFSTNLKGSYCTWQQKALSFMVFVLIYCSFRNGSIDEMSCIEYAKYQIANILFISWMNDVEHILFSLRKSEWYIVPFRTLETKIFTDQTVKNHVVYANSFLMNSYLCFHYIMKL